MVLAVALENNYCTMDDVITEVNKTDSVTPSFLAQVNFAINQASRLIDDYCYTKFFKQDFSTNFFDLRYKEHLKGSSDLYLFFPIGSITSIEENNTNLIASQYVLEEGSKIIRLDASSGELVDWGTKIRIKAKFGFNLPGGCIDAGWSTMPFTIRKQAAVFAAYLCGFIKVGEKTLTKTGKEIRQVPNIPMNSASNAGITDAYAFVPEVNSTTASPKTYSGKMDIMKFISPGSPAVSVDNKDISLGWEAPINQTETEGINTTGYIPKFEYAKLDPYRYLRF